MKDIVKEFCVRRKTLNNECPEPEYLSSTEAVEAFIKDKLQLQNEMQENFYLLMLGADLHLDSYTLLALGTTESVRVDMKVLLRAAILSGMSNLILVHNHPTGTADPSEEVIQLTTRIREVCRIMDLVLVDHIIINYKGEIYSFYKDENKENKE